PRPAQAQLQCGARRRSVVEELAHERELLLDAALRQPWKARHIDRVDRCERVSRVLGQPRPDAGEVGLACDRAWAALTVDALHQVAVAQSQLLGGAPSGLGTSAPAAWSARCRSSSTERPSSATVTS